MKTEMCKPDIELQAKKRRRSRSVIKMFSSNTSRDLVHECKDENNEVVLTIMQTFDWHKRTRCQRLCVRSAAWSVVRYA
jgi:hypothetical protein